MLRVCVLRDADVRRFIGVALWAYTEKQMGVCHNCTAVYRNGLLRSHVGCVPDMSTAISLSFHVNTV